MLAFMVCTLGLVLLGLEGVICSSLLNQCLEHALQVTTRNGTLCGMHSSHFNQDWFLGVPFAKPPVQDLRLRHPVSYDQQYHLYNAAANPPTCPGYAGFDAGLEPMREDCLYLNIVRPSGHRDEQLPVLVWIYGGGFDAGSVADQRYNMSYIVSNSVEIDKPILAIAINYRVGGWGFLASREVLADDAANIGLWDQRMALRWIKENVASFGGDPDKITIWGESAGAFSVGYHLLANGGDSEGLFRAAIMDSGTALGSQMQDAAQIASKGGYQELFDNVTATVGCENARDKMDCLRLVPYERLFNAFEPQVYNPIIDGVFIDRLPSESFAGGRVADVSLLLGANTDEGTATFWGPRGTLNTTTDVVAWIKTLNSTMFTSKDISDLLELYPDDPAQGCPFGTGKQRFTSQGWMYKRGAAIATDKFVHAGRRGTAQYFAKRQGCAVWSYRFDQAPWNGLMKLIATTPPVYATHYSELGFVFNNPNSSLSNWIGPAKAYHDLSAAMSKAWISFVHDLNPNIRSNTEIPSWPEYRKTEKNMVLRTKQSGGSYIEKDNYRQAQIAWWNDHWKIFGT